MTDVARFYHDVINDVINGVKDEWVEEGLDLQVLDELRKLWETKLADTHVFDPEPQTNTAAQYLNLIQRSQFQIRSTASMPLSHPNVAVPVRPLNPTAPHAINLPGTLATIRPSIARTTSERPQLQPATQVQRLPQQHTMVHGNLVSNVPSIVGINAPPTGAPIHVQSSRAVVPTALQSGTAPQIAALPSGLTGQLVQIGQQTYLVPQTLVGLRQQAGTSHLTIPQFVSAAGTSTAATTLSAAADPSSFSQTQVDGGHDSDDSKYCDTPSSLQPTLGAAGQHTGSRLGTDRSVNPSDLEDDDDDDDDDFVAATPGFTPSSVRSHYPPTSRDMAPGNGMRLGTMNTGNSMNSGPPTPATPLSVAPRTPFDSVSGWRRPTPGRHTPGASATPARKRRRRSSFHGADTDTEVDDYEDEDGSDVGEEVELMTNATMTPAVHDGDLEDDDDLHAVKPHRSPRRAKRPGANGRQAHANSNHGLSDNLLSPGSQLGDIPSEPPDTVGDGDLPHVGDEGEEEEEDDEPLNSEDDVSDEEPEVLFESDNVVVCQYDKIHRSRNRWRFHLKDGIMAINGRDHLFQKAVGEAEW